jgi:squalene-hopene/tetraprenyl-beta-curcumene cyclase
MDALPEHLKAKCDKSITRLLKWMEKTQAPDGSWTPLWFGDQNAKDERSPVYGTATTVEYLADSQSPIARKMAQKGLRYLLSIQNADGGWGSAKNIPSKITLTSRVLSALSSYPGTLPSPESATQACHYLCRKFESGEWNQEEPIGLYFARLWYSEQLYPITFLLNALKKYKLRLGDRV